MRQSLLSAVVLVVGIVGWIGGGHWHAVDRTAARPATEAPRSVQRSSPDDRQWGRIRTQVGNPPAQLTTPAAEALVSETILDADWFERRYEPTTATVNIGEELLVEPASSRADSSATVNVGPILDVEDVQEFGTTQIQESGPPRDVDSDSTPGGHPSQKGKELFPAADDLTLLLQEGV